MKKIPQPLRIWPLKEAPRRYRKLLREEQAKGNIDKETRRQMAWVASLKGEMARRVFWGTNNNDAATPGSFAQLTRGGVIFHRVDGLEETTFYFTDNDEAMESST